MNKNILIAVLLFTLGQAIVWFQANMQFFNSWAKEKPFLMALLGIPASYIFIHAYRFIVEGFDGLLWPGRLIGFAMGMVVMALFTYIYMGESINLKTGLTLILSLMIIIIQIY